MEWTIRVIVGRFNLDPHIDYYYRAMYFSAKGGIGIACRPSVCTSVCDVGVSG